MLDRLVAKSPVIRILVLVDPALLLVSCTNKAAVKIQNSGPPTGAQMFSESEAYERFMGRWSRRLAPAFLEFSGLEHDESVLDVGSGTGALAAAILSAPSSSRVVGVDPSAEYIEYARDRTKSDRASFEVGDGQALRFRDDSFDRTLSLLVINFIPDPGKAVSEMYRVTKPGGVVAACVWDYDEGMEMLRVFWNEVVALDPSAESRDERHMPYCQLDELRELWEKGGLNDVEVAPLVIRADFNSFEEFWQPFLEGQGPAGAYVASLSRNHQTRLRERLRKRLSSNQESGQITLSMRAWAVKGTVPTGQ